VQLYSCDRTFDLVWRTWCHWHLDVTYHRCYWPIPRTRLHLTATCYSICRLLAVTLLLSKTLTLRYCLTLRFDSLHWSPRFIFSMALVNLHTYSHSSPHRHAHTLINLCFTRSTTTCLKTACSQSSTTPSSLPVEMGNIAIAIALDMPRKCMSKLLLCSSKLARCCMCLYESSVTV